MNPAVTDYIEILGQFPSVDLTNMDKVKLMDRKDTKFMFREEHLAEILQGLTGEYRVLWVNDCFSCPYESLYYDTPEYQFYYDHHRGKLNRYKVRYRKYLGTNTSFFEIKHKNAKERTIKNRVRVSVVPGHLGIIESDFLYSNTFLPGENLSLAIRVTFNRITLVNLNSPERVTLDTHLTFYHQDHLLTLPGIIIAEAKQDKTVVSPFVARMKQRHIRKGSISKYCLGMSLLVPDIKCNNFKSKIHTLKKLIHDTPAGIK